MKAMHFRHIISLVSLLVFLLTAQTGVQGYVWCLGEDGRSALEYAAVDTCRSGAQPLDQASRWEGIFDFLSQEKRCGPCLDVPFSFDAASRRAQVHKIFPSHIGSPATVQVSPVPNFARVFTTNLYPQPPPRISQTIHFQRTVVLLN
jgi:hypothetical protein